MQNSKFSPTNSDQYSSKDLNADYRGKKFVAIAGQATTYDYLVSNDYLVDGAVVYVHGAAFGDKVNFQVIDKDNVMGYGANVVLGHYVFDWYINPDEAYQYDFKSVYPAKIFSGLYMRTIYTSVGTENANVIINYKLHKCLW